MRIRDFWDDRGQATVEYVIMLAVVVGFAVLFIREFVKPALEIVQKAVSEQIDKRLFQGDLHRFPVGRR